MSEESVESGPPHYDWNAQQVAQWLRTYDDGYFNHETLKDITGRALLSLTKDDLKSGIGAIKGAALYNVLHSTQPSQASPLILTPEVLDQILAHVKVSFLTSNMEALKVSNKLRSGTWKTRPQITPLKDRKRKKGKPLL